MVIECNGPGLITAHIDGCEITGKPVDLKYLKEISQMTADYMREYEVTGVSWHEFRDEWLEKYLKKNKSYSPRWRK